MEELIRQAQKGDKQAFSELILSISDELYKIARTRISIEDDIEDAIQETMIEVYKSIKRLKDPGKFKKWTFKILINKCNRIYRKKYKDDVSIEDEKSLKIDANSIEKLEHEIDFYELIQDLKYEEKLIATLYYMEDYSVKEIKDILKMNENTINTHLFRARQKLKNKYMGGNIYEG